MNVVHAPLSQFNRNTRLFIAASAIFALGFFGIQTLLRVLYVLRLGHGPRYVGMFESAGAFTYMSMGMVSGAMGRRLGIRRTLLLGGIVTAIGMTALPLSEFVPPWAREFWPIVSNVATIAGWSILNVNLVAAMATTTTRRNRNSAYALGSATRGAGMLAGTVFGGVLPGLFARVLHQNLNMPGPYRCGLWVGAGLASLGLIPLSLVGPVEPVASRQPARPRAALPLLPIVLMGVYVCLRHAGWATSQAFWNAYMDTALSVQTSSIGLITGAGQVLAILASLLTPRLANRHGNGWLAMISTLAVAIGLIPLVLIPHWTAAAGAQLCVLAMSAVWLPALQAFQMEMVDSTWRSTAYGAVSMAMGLGYGLVSLAGGYVVEAAGYRVLFLVGVVLTAMSVGPIWIVLRRRSARAAQPDSNPGTPGDEERAI